MRGYRLHDTGWSRILRYRVQQPDGLQSRLVSRRRRPSLVPDDGHLVLLAANHRADPRSGAVVSRRELLDRVVEALSVPEVDGVIASPDLLEELTVLNVLEHRAAFSKQAGEPSLAYFDGHVVARPEHVSPTVPTVVELSPGHVTADGEGAAWIDAVHETSEVVATGAGLWLSVPPVPGFSDVAAASGFPILVRDVDVPIDPDAWIRFFTSELPETVRGAVLGMSALFPHAGSVAEVTDAIAGSIRALTAEQSSFGGS